LDKHAAPKIRKFRVGSDADWEDRPYGLSVFDEGPALRVCSFGLVDLIEDDKGGMSAEVDRDQGPFLARRVVSSLANSRPA